MLAVSARPAIPAIDLAFMTMSSFKICCRCADLFAGSGMSFAGLSLLVTKRPKNFPSRVGAAGLIGRNALRLLREPPCMQIKEPRCSALLLSLARAHDFRRTPLEAIWP